MAIEICVWQALFCSCWCHWHSEGVLTLLVFPSQTIFVVSSNWNRLERVFTMKWLCVWCIAFLHALIKSQLHCYGFAKSVVVTPTVPFVRKYNEPKKVVKNIRNIYHSRDIFNYSCWPIDVYFMTVNIFNELNTKRSYNGGKGTAMLRQNVKGRRKNQQQIRMDSTIMLSLLCWHMSF